MTLDDYDEVLYSYVSTEELVKRAKNITYTEYMKYLMKKYNVKQVDIKKRCGLDPRAASKVINAENKSPHKDRIYRVALTIGVTVKECDALLNLANSGGLCEYNTRDIVLMRGLVEHRSVMEVDIQLEAMGFPVLNGGVK